MFETARAALGSAAFKEALPLLREPPSPARAGEGRGEGLPEGEATRAYLVVALQVLAGMETGLPEVERIIRRHLGEVTLAPELADLPGVLIQDLIAPERRRAAGEFYTPRWLAERTVMLSGFVEAEEGTLLDPCCGAGAMLVAAMRLRGARLEQQGLPPRKIASQLVARVSGYDLNPLAVLAARVACWAVLGQWIPGKRPELRIEVGDALDDPCTSPPAPLLRPRQEGGAFDDCTDVEEPETSSRSYGRGGKLDAYSSGLPETTGRTLERGGKLDVYSSGPPETTGRTLGRGGKLDVYSSGPPETAGHDLTVHLAGNQHQENPHAENALGGNSQAAPPLVSGSLAPGKSSSAPLPRRRRGGGAGGGVEGSQVSFLVGNPPWIRWSDVPAHQADRVREVARSLDLIPRQVWHGGSEVDLSVVIALATSANHLNVGGRSALVLPRSHLHAPASAPFRRLQLQDGTRLRLEAIEDFEDVPAFRGASVKPVIAVWSRGDAAGSTTCARYERLSTPAGDDSWARASLRRIEKTLQISSADGRWCLMDPASPMSFRLLGETTWVRGRKGVTTDLNEAYFVRVVDRSGQLARVAPLVGRRGRRLSHEEFDIEADLLWPLLKGAAQIEPFRCLEEDAWVIVPNSGIQQYPSLDEFTSKHPAAADYFAQLERDSGGALSRRATFRRTLASHGAPYFLVYNVGEYTFRPFKVVWPEITSLFRAAVALPRAGRAVVPDHKVYFAAFDELEPADFLCAFLNAPMVRHAVEASTARLQIGTLLRQVRVPSFDAHNAAHAELARLGALAREQGTQPDAARLDRLVEQTLQG